VSTMGRKIIEIFIICHLIWAVWLYGDPNIFAEVKNKFVIRFCNRSPIWVHKNLKNRVF